MIFYRNSLLLEVFFCTLFCLYAHVYALETGNKQSVQISQELAWDAEISGNALKVNHNKFSSPYSQEKFPFVFIGKQNYEGFYKNTIYFLEPHGYPTFNFDLKDKLFTISLDGNYFLGQKENDDPKKSYRFTYSQNHNQEIIWDQYKIDKNTENVYLSPQGDYIIFTHGISTQMVSYIQFINDKGDIYATHNFPAQSVTFAPTGNYLLTCNGNKFIVIGRSGNKIIENSVEGKINKKQITMSHKGTSVISTEDEPYSLYAFSISGSKRMELKLKDSLRGVDISEDDNYLVFFQEVFAGDVLSYSMKFVDIKTSKELWDRKLPLYTEEYPEIYLGKNFILLYFNKGQNQKDQHLVYVYDLNGNLLSQYSYPQKPIFSEDRKYILIFNAPKIQIFQLNI
ncbi:hypothetical protein HZA55_05215 [Candidatus Poribacteria bacterium]|nr:hypothetical protein [Candidatus Poribacteria bacterium]